MQTCFNAVIEGIKAVFETDFTRDLGEFDAPTLILHGDDDQIVPIGASAMLSSTVVKNARREIYKGPAARHVLVSQGPDQRRPLVLHQEPSPEQHRRSPPLGAVAAGRRQRKSQAPVAF
jgi:pimeloyl-ACP methyl ester carboxylesterase